MTDTTNDAGADMNAIEAIFKDELDALRGVQQSILEKVMANQTPTAQNIGRQTLDHLDAAALFLQSMAMYLVMSEKAVEAKLASGDLKVVEGGKQDS